MNMNATAQTFFAGPQEYKKSPKGAQYKRVRIADTDYDLPVRRRQITEGEVLAYMLAKWDVHPHPFGWVLTKKPE